MPAASAPEPFPWSALDRLTGAQARAVNRARRQVAPHLGVAALAEGCSRLLGRPLSIEIVATWADDALPSGQTHVSVPLARGDGSTGLVLSIENALALRLAAIVVGQPIAWPDPARPLAPEIAGAAAAFLTVAARQTGAPWRLGPGDAPAGPFACVRAVVLLGEDVFDALAAAPLAPGPPPPASLTRHALAALGALPLALPVIAATSGASDDDLAALAPGSAWAPGDAWTLRREPGGPWRGRALLAAPTAEVGLDVAADEGGLRLGRGLVACPCDAPPEGDDAPGLRALRVEVGAIALEARAWAALAPGARLPEVASGAVTLRVGGRAIARGRLARVGGEDVVLVDETATA
ncbi:MAG TPA: hypothetical protein VFS00_14885, partial [Polyangiaceae bacterium]|nr:hypothetical protein [Polyangiaceae bacterium]